MSLLLAGFSAVAQCTAFMAPYTESFDVVGTPTCWSQYANSGGPWSFSQGSGVNTACGVPSEHTGNAGYFAWMDQSGSDDSVALEMYDVDVSALTTAYLQFYYFECGSNVTTQNFLYIEAWDGAAWVSVDTIHQATNGWEAFGFDISGHTYGANLVKIRFRAESGGDINDYYADNLIDDVSIIEAPTCFLPSGLTATNITASSADLGWTANTGETSWDIEWGAAGFALGAGTLVPNTSSNPYALTGLSGITGYAFYVRGICGAGDTSQWAGPFSFTTLCGNYLPNYIEDFTTFVPTCWEEFQGVLGASSTTITTASTSDWSSDGFGNNGSSGSARMNIYATGRDEWLVSPTIDLGTGATPYQLQYDVALTPYSGTGTATFGADDTLAVVISTDNGVTWSQTNILQVYTAGSEPSNTGDFTVISLTGYTGLVKFGFYAASSVSGGDINAYIDNFEVRDVPNCPQPTSVAVDSLTSTIGYLSWAVGAADAIIEYGPSGFTPGSGTFLTVSGGTASITGLTGATDYEFYIQDSCGVGNVSPWTGPVSFTTDCPIYTPTYTENFATFIPVCWEEFQGILGATGTTVTNATISNWTSDGFGNVGSSGAAKMNIYSTGRDEWLVSPSIDLGAGTIGYQVAFDIALTNFGNTSATVFGADDTLAIVISTDNGVTWSQANILQVWGAGTEPSNTGDYVIIDLSAYTGIVKFGFYAASSVSNEDNDLSIDNFVVEPIPTCPKPLNLGILNLALTSVDLSWSSGGGETEWSIEWDTLGFAPGTGNIVATTMSNPYNLIGLTPKTNYEFYVKGICAVGDSSVWSGPFSFYTGSCIPAPSSQDGSGITNVTLGTINNTTGSEPGYYGDYSAMSADVIQGAPAQAFSIEYSTGYSYGTKIWVDWNEDLVFDSAEEVYFGLSGSANPSVLSGTFAIPSTVALGSYAMRIGGTDNNSGPSDACYTGSYGVFEDYTLNVIAPCYVAATDVQAACDSYTWTDGVMYTASNSTAVDTLKSNVAGVCDTIFTLDLTINTSTTGTDVLVACDTYTWIDGVTYTASNSSATFVLSNAIGCDSTVTLDLTINNAATGTDVQVACDTYTWIDGMTYTSSNNSATHTIVAGAINGCDSIVTLDLTINNSDVATDFQVACDMYTWIDGNTYTASNNIAMYTLTNVNGCDSVVTLNLTMSSSTSATATHAACESYTWIDGVTYTTSNNTATYTIPNTNGCDSVITLDLTINMPTANAVTATECESYMSAAGNTYTSTGVYTEVFAGANGCDSVLTIDLTITNANYTVSVSSGIHLTSNQPGATYQWLDCSNGNAQIAGATNQVYVATVNGDYACEVTYQTCSGTSACVTVNSVGIEDATNTFASVYPNPVNELLTVTLSDLDNAQFELMDVQGKMIMSSTINNGEQIDMSHLESGIYFVRLISNENRMIKRVVKN